ncbi:MAG: hypothetical protein BGO77_03055 [Caedibacter sp. 37-49]|nr:MAG: hypothetical protein BGO77_03055 [Caedibacter sp. 37-49]
MNSLPEIIIYKTESGEASVEVLKEQETLWLSLNQLAHLFERDKSAISRHLKSIFDSQELDPSSTVANFATVQKEGDRKVERQIEYYNLDVIISLGYRVNSKRGVEFRQWASQVLKDHLIKGYSLNQNKLLKSGLEKVEKAIALLSRTLQQNAIISDVGQEAIHIIQTYTNSWKLLLDYDEGKIDFPKASHSNPKSLPYEFCKASILNLKKHLIEKKEAGEIFGIEKDKGFTAILGNIDQTFDSHPLYKSVEERAAHLLYFIIKDHPFNDGNKRIGSLLFLLYLELNKIKAPKINDTTLVALALLVAESDPKEKDLLIRLITNLISGT